MFGPSLQVSQSNSGPIHALANPRPANALAGGKDDSLYPAQQVRVRHKAHPPLCHGKAAVGTGSAIVAQHEILACRHDDFCHVCKRPGAACPYQLGLAARQRLPAKPVFHRFAGDRQTVQHKHSTLQRYPVAAAADDPLDIVLASSAGKHDHVAMLCRAVCKARASCI